MHRADVSSRFQNAVATVYVIAAPIFPVIERNTRLGMVDVVAERVVDLKVKDK